MLSSSKILMLSSLDTIEACHNILNYHDGFIVKTFLFKFLAKFFGVSPKQGPQGSFALGVVVVVVYFLWFYFHEDGMINVNHDYTLPQQLHYSAWLTILESDCSCASLESFKVMDGLRRKLK